jgi:transcriptional regulator with XRE-family HTH domain
MRKLRSTDVFSNRNVFLTEWRHSHMNETALRLKQWRKEQGLTLRQVGEAVGRELGGPPLSPNSVSNHERRGGPTLSFLIALSRAYKEDLDVYWLMHGEPREAAAWEESGDGVYFAPEEETDEVRALIDRLVEAPFGYPEVFLSAGELTTAERITYNMAARTALRTIARALCNDARRFGPSETRG